MNTSEQDRYHIERVQGRIESEDALAAFERLMAWCDSTRGVFVYPLSRGPLSAIYLAARPVSRKYADCPFGFLGARDHLRWIFRGPCFDTGLCDQTDVERRFECDVNDNSGELMTNLHTLADANAVIAFIGPLLARRKA